MIRRPPRSTRTDTLFPYTTLFRSKHHSAAGYWEVRRAGVALCFSVTNPLRGCRATRPRSRCRKRSRCGARSEEHTSELQSLMRISYAVFCLKKKKKTKKKTINKHHA